MTNSLASSIYNRLPANLAETLIRRDMSRRALLRMVPHQDVIIQSGVARGVWVNCNRSNPAYSLGNNELIVQKIFQTHLQPGDVLFDIGANVGFFTVISARLVGQQGHIYAFEPEAENVAAIRHNVVLNGFGNVTVIDSAVSDKSGQGELLVAHYSGGSALSTVDTPPPDLKETRVVETVSIDELMDNESLSRPKIVKIDVEGAELTVMKGMVETMRQYRPIILYEIDDADAAEFERKAQACAEFLSDFGYQIEPLAESYAEIDWQVGHFLAV